MTPVLLLGGDLLTSDISHWTVKFLQVGPSALWKMWTSRPPSSRATASARTLPVRQLLLCSNNMSGHGWPLAFHCLPLEKNVSCLKGLFKSGPLFDRGMTWAHANSPGNVVRELQHPQAIDHSCDPKGRRSISQRSLPKLWSQVVLLVLSRLRVFCWKLVPALGVRKGEQREPTFLPPTPAPFGDKTNPCCLGCSLVLPE